MKVRKLNIILTTAALLALGGCSSTSYLGQQADAGNAPILSAAQVQSMIRVEVRTLEPPTDVDTLIASTD